MFMSFKNKEIKNKEIISDKQKTEVENTVVRATVEDVKLHEAIAKTNAQNETIKEQQNLENKVKERTQKIHEMQDNQKQMMLDISHGLLTPLTIIKGELETMEQKSKDTQFKTFERSMDKVTLFIQKLLHLANLETKSKQAAS